MGWICLGIIGLIYGHVFLGIVSIIWGCITFSIGGLSIIFIYFLSFAVKNNTGVTTKATPNKMKPFTVIKGRKNPETSH